jgi:ParB family transcriptional regulator, chromosome partitioning protein
MNVQYDPKLRMIPIQQISVLNPRDRGKKKFATIVANIAKLGLKKPVTVAHIEGTNGDSRYALVCGQGRLEAYVQLGQKEIPAIVVEGTREDLLLMSLAENLARRRHSTVELVREISALKERGYSHSEISQKTALHVNYVRAILQLLAKGEDRLLQAVEKGQLPVNIAITIATADDKTVQRALQEAYESHDLRGKSLIRARRLIETRKARGRKLRSGPRQTGDGPVSTDSLLKTFQQETMRQKMTVHRAKLCETRLLFAVSALKRLLQDDHFVTLLRAEGLDSLPEPLAVKLEEHEAST